MAASDPWLKQTYVARWIYQYTLSVLPELDPRFSMCVEEDVMMDGYNVQFKHEDGVVHTHYVSHSDALDARKVMPALITHIKVTRP
jgi:hypothetical protein